MLSGDKQVSCLSTFIVAELEWFEAFLELRIADYFNQQSDAIFPIPPVVDSLSPLVSSDLVSNSYQDIVREHQLNVDERLVLMLALLPLLKPNALDLFFTKNKNTDRPFSEFGGAIGRTHGGFVPTLETALFLLAGGNTARRVSMLAKINDQNTLFKSGLVELKTNESLDSDCAAQLHVTGRALHRILGFNKSLSMIGSNLPASKIASKLALNELVLSDEIVEELKLIGTWVANQEAIQSKNGIGKYVMPGYRCLFWGPPGTGKTLAAAAVGEELNVDVYRIDLSMVVSKWIGETEKNLSVLFDEGERNGWILFFDEADALFARRSVSASSNDRYSNQQVSYLLQRMETYPGLVILATNLRTNLDEALMRRIQLFLHFPIPTVPQREALWTLMLSSLSHKSIDLYELAEEFELSGGIIANVVQYSVLASMRDKSDQISLSHIKSGISRELRKEGRIV